MISRVFILVVAIVWFFSSQKTEAQNVSEANFLNDFEKQVLVEMNKVRANPAKYAEEFLEPMQNAYDGKLLKMPGTIPLRTQEGKKALLECIREMKKTSPLPLLSPSEGLSQAANLLVKDQGKSGKVGHTGNKGSTPQTRVEQRGKWDVKLAENIAYGNQSPRRVVISLLIDDGVPSRSHRKNILDKAFKTIGIATGSHPNYGNMCVMEMAGSFQEK